MAAVNFLINKLKSANQRWLPRHLYYGPQWLVLGVNNICNLHCKMCDVGVDYNKSNFFQNLMGSRPLNMPIELIREIFGQAKRFYPRVKIGYAFTEPLIYPHLMESLHYARELGLYTAITTNALNLKRYADGLLEAGIHDIFVSLDGPEEIHNAIRGHKSSYQKAMEGMEYILSQPKPPRISVFCCITEWNVGHLERFLEGMSALALNRVGFMHTNYTPQNIADRHNALWGHRYPATASNMEEINLEKIPLAPLWAEMQRIKNREWPFPVLFSPEIRSPEGLEVFYHHPEILIGQRCTDIFNNIMIKSNGDVIPAHGRCYNLPIGNLYQQSLQTIWKGPAIAQFRSDLNKAGGLLPACARCCSAF